MHDKHRSIDASSSARWVLEKVIENISYHLGSVTGAMNTFGNLGGMLAPLVVGYVVRKFGSWNAVFQVSAAIYALGGLLWLVIDPTRRLGAEA